MPLDGPEPVPTVPLVLFDYSGKIRLSFKMAEQVGLASLPSVGAVDVCVRACTFVGDVWEGRVEVRI